MVGNVGCCGLLQPCCHRHDPQNYIIEGAFEIDYSPRLSLCASGLSLAVRIYSQDNVDPSTGKGKKSENAYITRGKTKTIMGMDVPTKVIELKLRFEVARDFGDPGALVVENRDKHEFFLKSASLNYTNRSDVPFRFYCGSWVYPISKTRTKRIFFSNQLYLPQKTPRGLEKLRQKELGKLRGGSKDKRKDERKKWDRIYEYDCYNDLGDPDNGKQHARPILGGSQFPYPRRLRTGRSPCREDLLAESRPVSCSQIYVPLDERLSHEKQEELKNNFVDALVRFLAQESTRTPLFNQECPDFVAKIAHFFVPKGAIPIEDFKFMRSIGDFLGKKPKPSPNQDPRHDDRFGIEDLFADKEVKGLEDSIKQKLQKLVPNKIFEDITTAATKRRSVSSQPPSIIAEDKTQWSDDLEFGRQMLAGTNPVRIHRMKDDDLKLIGREFGKLMEEDDDLRLIWRELGKLVQEDDGLKLILKVLRKLIEKDDDLKHIGEEIGELTEEDDGLKLILGVLGKLIEKNDDLKHIGDDLKHIGEENGEVIEEDFGLYLIVGVLGNLIEKDDGPKLISRVLKKLIEEEDGLKLILGVLGKLIEMDDGPKLILGLLWELIEKGDGFYLILRVLGKLIEKGDGLKLISGVLGKLIEKDDDLKLEWGEIGKLIKEAGNENNILFILEHRDYLMPFLTSIKGKGVCAYATRTILLQVKPGRIYPIAIELSLPDYFNGQKDIWVSSLSHSDDHIWELAKIHVASNDAAYHQLISHWLHTHAIVEPFIIATRRQLSVMHPIHRLLHPHFRDTLHVNALARAIFLNAGGILETTLFTGEFSMRVSSHLYKQWRLNEQALPQDLIKRGMATANSKEDENKSTDSKEKKKTLAQSESAKIDDVVKSVERDKEAVEPDKMPAKDKQQQLPTFDAGVKLVIEDYPYAKDGLEIWVAIETWVKDYCKLFYKEDSDVIKDAEIQAWWSEIRIDGHGDQQQGWYDINTVEDLVRALTTLIWITSGLHAAVNFGQYGYYGYAPNRPMLLRKFIPREGTPEMKELKEHPKEFFAGMLPEKFQMAFVAAVMDVLSRHTSDEVYLGQPSPEKEWEKPEIGRKFADFRKKLKQIEGHIRERNKKYELFNRYGSVKIPYMLLYPYASKTKAASSKGEPEKMDINERGIPNSISI